MSDIPSFKRIKCMDYSKRHKKAVYKTKSMRLYNVGDLADEIKKIVGTSVSVNRDDSLCSHCIDFYRKKILELENESDEEILQPDETFIPKNEIVNALNQSIITLDADISPLKQPSQIREERKESYVKRKKVDLKETFMASAINRLEDVYGTNVEHESTLQQNTCSDCEEWFTNLSTALHNCKYNEKVQLLTLVPEKFSKREVREKLPDVSKYLIDKSRKIKKNKGIYAQLDPYTGHPLPTEVLNIAMSYYLEDSKDCTRDNPNKNDVICVRDDDGEKIKRVKRFLTRSIKETYNLMIKENPSIEIGMSKFYSLRPKYVKIQPIQAVCCCIYCSNLKLMCIALKNLTGLQILEEDLMRKCLCPTTNNENCWLEKCSECPGTDILTAETFDLNEDEEAIYAVWESGDLIKKSVPVKKFLEDVKYWVRKGIFHNHIKKIQREGIADIKLHAKENSVLVMHFDFAENWCVILPDEIQSYHWQNAQISLFTCVTYIQEEIKSFIVVSDDITHDTTHALCAIETIKKEIYKLYQLKTFESIVYISDGAAAHFKNKYQFYEMCKNEEVAVKKWIFSATGHGKSACDAIGGLCKHYATKYNLANEPIKAIRDSVSFVTTISSLVKNITLLPLDNKIIQTSRINKEKEYANVKSIIGIRCKHYWVSENNKGYMGITVKNQIREVETSNQVKKQYSIHDFKIGEFIGCIYENHWWTGQISCISLELKDLIVSFMHPHGPAHGFQWPEESGKKKDECAVPLENVLLKIGNPTPIGLSARLHTFDDAELKLIQEIYSA